jgi:hypothetical protein
MTLLLLCAGAALAMAAQDYCGTLCVIAEAHGRAHQAGLWDAAGDAARISTAAISVDAVLHHGPTYAAPVIATVMAVSYLVTSTVVRHSRPA